MAREVSRESPGLALGACVTGSSVRNPSRWRHRATLSLVGAALIACGESGSAPESPQAGVPAPALLEVHTVAVERGTIAQRITAPGSLDALRESHIGAEVRGPKRHGQENQQDRQPQDLKQTPHPSVQCGDAREIIGEIQAEPKQDQPGCDQA